MLLVSTFLGLWVVFIRGISFKRDHKITENILILTST